MYENLPDSEAAQLCDSELVSFERRYKFAFVELGLMLLTCESRGLFRFLVNPETEQPFTSWDRWVIVRAPASRSYCYEAKKSVKELVRDIPEEELKTVPHKNIEPLIKLSSADRKKEEVLSAAKEQSKDEFLGLLEKEYPYSHQEATKQLVITLDKSAYEFVTERLGAFVREHGLRNYAEALEAILADMEAPMREEATAPLASLVNQNAYGPIA